jgi:outer membrane receptor for ferrienterochelin and colicin
MISENFLKCARVLTVLVSLIGWPVWAAGQSGVGTAALSGRVVDESKAAMPGVRVALTNTETGVVRTAITNEEGLYRLLAVQPGVYALEFELDGFAKVRQGPLTLLVGQDLQVGATLALASLKETVTVSGAAPLVEPTKTEVASYITEKQIDSLPVNGRTLNDFVALNPGVVSTGVTGSGTGTLSQNISVGGTASTQTSQNIDGANSDDQFYAAPRNDYSQEAVQEFQVIANSFPAEFGRASGGIVNIFLKSGTNTFKGGTFGFFRDDALDTTDSLTKAAGLAQAPFSRRQWGGSLGGPIKRDKAFFFVTAERQDFERTSFTAADADIARALGLDPQAGELTVVDDNSKFTSKVDYNLGNNSSMNARYDFFDAKFLGDTATFGSLGPGLDHPTTFTTRLFRGHTAFLGWNRTFRQSFMNELRVRYNAFDDIRRSPQDQPANVRVSGAGLYFYNFRSSDFINRRTVGFANNLSWVKGEHNIKAGVDYLREDDVWNYQAYRKPQITFSNKAAFFANTPQEILIGFGDTEIENDNNMVAAFVQDQWRLNAKMTLNLGVRWDGEFYRKAFPQDPDPDRNNFAPRIGIAYAPTPRTSVHAAGGMFYGQIFGLLLQNIRQTQLRRQYSIDGEAARVLWARYRQNMDAAANTPSEQEVLALPGIKPIDIGPGLPEPGLESPYAYQGSVGAQHQFATNMAVKVNYLYVGARNETVGREINLAPPLFFQEGQAMPNGLVAPPGGGYFYNRNNRVSLAYNGYNQFEGRGRSDYHAMAIGLQRRFSGSFGFDVAYTWSRARGNGEQFGGTTIPDDIAFDDGYSSNHFPHRLAINGVWDIKAGESLALRDWQLSGIYVYQSGRATNVTYDTPSGCFGLLGCQLRPEPYLERNSYLGDDFHSLDIRVSRSIAFGGARRLLFAVDVFNLFNYEQFNILTNYGAYPWRVNADGTIPAKPDFSQPGVGARFGTATRVINSPRQAQIGFRLSF